MPVLIQLGVHHLDIQNENVKWNRSNFTNTLFIQCKYLPTMSVLYSMFANRFYLH